MKKSILLTLCLVLLCFVFCSCSDDSSSLNFDSDFNDYFDSDYDSDYDDYLDFDSDYDDLDYDSYYDDLDYDDYDSYYDDASSISSDMLGTWYVYEGADDHYITIKDNGTLVAVDGGSSEVMDYQVESDTEITIWYNGELGYTFELDGDMLYRYENGVDDTYIYMK